MSIEELSDREIALTCHDALSHQLITFQAVRDWGDCMLTSAESPPIWAIDLACCHAEDVIERLLAVPGTADETRSESLLLGLVSARWKAGKLTTSTLHRIGWDLYRDHSDSGADHWGLLLDLAREAEAEGYGSASEVEAVAAQAVAQFSRHESLVPTWMQ